MNQQAPYGEQQSRLEEEIRRQYEELQRHKPNILVVGRAGAGKSSLINAVLGEKLAETGAGKPVTQHYQTYAHPLVTMIDSVGLVAGHEGDQRFREDTEQLLKQHRTTNPDDHIHIVWYIFSASEARVEPFDVRLVREAFAGIPVLFVLTKCDIATEAQISEMERVLQTATTEMAQQATKNQPAPRIVGIIRTAADPLPALRQEPWGITDVIEATRRELPELYRAAFDAAQAVDFSLKARRARGIIHAASATAGGIGFVPIPFSDAALLTPLQMSMVASIGLIYGFGNEPKSLTALISGSIMPLVAESAGVSIAGNLIKMIPGAGSIAGGMVNGAVAASITASIGYAFQYAFHQLALMKAKNPEAVTSDAAAEFLKQAVPRVMQQARQRGIKNFLQDGGDVE